MLRGMLWRDSAASKVGRVMAKLRADLAAEITVPEMAKMAGMSVSLFTTTSSRSRAPRRCNITRNFD